jgi:TPR repeat protein
VTPALLLLAVVAAERLAELWLARRNTAALVAEGAREVAPEHYPAIVALHALWLSQGLLGQLYDHGAGVPQDHERAASLWRSEMATVWPRALLGYADAEDALAEIYMNGWGVEQNYEKAIGWYRKAAEGGNVDAQNAMGLAYSDGLLGVSKAPWEAAEWYRKAAEQGSEDAQRSLGFLYYNGDLGSKDPVQAAKWFRKAAEQGDSISAELLARQYLHGEGVPRVMRRPPCGIASRLNAVASIPRLNWLRCTPRALACHRTSLRHTCGLI